MDSMKRCSGFGKRVSCFREQCHFESCSIQGDNIPKRRGKSIVCRGRGAEFGGGGEAALAGGVVSC